MKDMVTSEVYQTDTGTEINTDLFYIKTEGEHIKVYRKKMMGKKLIFDSNKTKKEQRA